MRFFLEIVLIIVVICQYIVIRNYQLEIEQLCTELNFLLKKPNRISDNKRRIARNDDKFIA